LPLQDEFKVKLRRTVMRYVNVSTILTYRLVSNSVNIRDLFLDSFILINGIS
jgi:hypothetical protein